LARGFGNNSQLDDAARDGAGGVGYHHTVGAGIGSLHSGQGKCIAGRAGQDLSRDIQADLPPLIVERAGAGGSDGEADRIAGEDTDGSIGRLSENGRWNGPGRGRQTVRGDLLDFGVGQAAIPDRRIINAASKEIGRGGSHQGADGGGFERGIGARAGKVGFVQRAVHK